MVGTFSEHALAAVQEMLYAEGQVNPLEGECNQKAKRQAKAKTRSSAQEAADQKRAQTARAGVNRGNRSEAAKKAAATRAKCKSAQPNPPQQPSLPQQP